MIIDLLFFLVSLFTLVKSAEYAVGFASKIAKVFKLSEFIVSFFIISFISCFPEATVAIVSAFEGIPEFGLGALLGSNVADLCFVFGIAAAVSLNGIRVKSEVLKNDLYYLTLLLIPIILGIDSNFSRLDGVILILSGLAFFAVLSMQSRLFTRKYNHASDKRWALNLFLLVIALVILIISAYFTVEFGVAFAGDVGIPSFLIALTLISVGTCMPELVFSLKAVKTGHDELALGDVLGTVVIDATIIVGVIALINPFSFSPSTIYVTGILMLLSGYLLFYLIKSKGSLTRKDGIYLLLFYLVTLLIEIYINYLS